MNEKQILQELHDVGKAYAEGRFLLLCMQQLYTAETEPDHSTLGRTIRTVRFGGASATLSRKTNGTYDLVLVMPGTAPLCVCREHAWECARDMESVLAHGYDGAVVTVQDRYRELTYARDRLQARQEDEETVVRYYEGADGNTVRIQARVHRSIYNGLPDGVRIKVSFMIFNTEVEDMAGLKKALNSIPVPKLGDVVDLQDIADNLRKKAFGILDRMFTLDTHTRSKFEGRTEVTPDDLDGSFKDALKF